MNRFFCAILTGILLPSAPGLFAAGNLFINEVMFNPPTSPDNPFEYIELRGASGEVIPAKTYFLAIEGSTNNPGKIRNYFELGGMQIGTNGFLVLLQKTHSYATVTGSTVLSNTATKGGWGDIPNSTVGHCGDDGRTNIVSDPVTFLLVRCVTAPDPHLDIDTNNDGLFDGEALGWTILDGVGIFGNEPAGSYGYGKINFRNGGSASATNLVPLSFTPSYVGRNGHSTGWASNDWVLADVVTNGVTKWKLDSSNVHPTSRANALLDHIGGSNFGAPFNHTPRLTHSEALSGVVNHPDNPLLRLTISDAETAVNTLQVSATSLDATALPTNRVTVTYTNSQWIVRIAPTNVCYNVSVRVRVSDGTNYSENILPYAASGLWGTNVGFHIGISDASSAIPLDANYMLIADDETFPLRLYTRTNCGLPVKEFTFTNSLALTNLDGEELAEMDVEASSRFGDRIYWLGSLGNITDGPLAPNRNRLFATDISGSGTNVQLSYVGRYDKLRDDVLKWDAEGKHGKGAGYYGLEVSAAVLHPPKTNDGFNVEGFSFIANGGSNQAYIGLRSPLVPRGERRRALLIPVLNLASLVTNNPAVGPAQLGGAVELDLGGRGIRSIEHINGTYWIVAGPCGDSTDDPYEFRLFTWSGNVLQAPQMWSASFGNIRPEGIVDVRTNGLVVEIQVIGDQGFSKLYEPATNSTSKKSAHLGFRQFRVEWVSIGNPESLPVMTANFGGAGATRFIRGSGSSNQWLSVVEALDGVPGVRLDEGGGNASAFYPGHNWTNQLRHWNATNTAQPLLFTNPLAAFGSLAGMPTLYVGRTYHFHIAAGTAVGTNRQTLRITAYDRVTKQEMGRQDAQLPSPADTNYPVFFERGLVFNFPMYGIDTRILPQFGGGAPLHEFSLEHRASKAEYFFVVSLNGQVLSNSAAAPVVWSNAGAVPSPLYVLNFDLEPAWQSHFLAQAHLNGEPSPSAFLGKSAQELRSTNLVNNMSLVVTQALSTLTNVDLSPELRAHPRLDRLVSDYDRDPVALANYVFNEVLLTDAFSPGAASSVLRSGGVRRGALAAYMEGQASPLEQCGLLVYLLRRCGVPCGYVFPTSGTLKLHEKALTRLFPFTVQVSGATNGDAFVEADYPCVAAYVDGAWRIVAPWMKDLEVQEGLDITDYTPPRYRTGRDWVMGYLRFDQELMKLAFKSDTPTTLFPRYLKQMLQDNYTGLSVSDFGVRVRTRKHHYSRWSDFPLPAVLTGTNTVVESLATLMESQPAYSNLFERVEVEVTSTTNASRTLTTGKVRLLDLHNRVLQLWFVETNGSHWMNLGLHPFRGELTNAVAFSNAATASLISTQALQELRDTVLLDGTDDELKLRLTWHRYQPPTNSGSTVIPAVTMFRPDLSTNASVIERKLRKGDLSTFCLDFGQSSTRMAEARAEDLKRARAMTNSGGVYLRPEWVDGLRAATAATAYFQRVDGFRGALARFYKTHVDSARSVAVSSLLAKRQTNGVLLSGAVQLARPRFDVCFRELSLIGNGSLRPDVNPANERAVQDFLDLSALNEGAQEHQVIAEQFGSTNVVSTVRLLQLSQLQGSLSLPGILKLTATNYVTYGNTEYGLGAGLKKLKEFDPVIWQTVESVFATPGLSNAALVLMTPGEIDSAVGKRVGALILSPRYHAALLNPGLNGAESDEAPAVENPSGSGFGMLFGNDGQWHDLAWFGHDLYGGDHRVSENPHLEDNGVVPPFSIEEIQKIRSLTDFSLSVQLSEDQLKDAIDSDPAWEAELERDYGLSPSATPQDIANIIDDIGGLLGRAFGPNFGNLVSDPVSPINGEFYVGETDLSLPGPIPLTISRSYSSRSVGEGAFGANWKINLTPYLVVLPGQTNIDAAEPDGTVLRYSKTAVNTFKPLWQNNVSYDNSSGPPGPAQNLINKLLVRTNSATVTNYVLRPGDGSARVYSWRGFPRNGKTYQRPWLTSWEDSTGNALRFEYGEDPLAFDYARVRRISSTSGSAVVLRYNERGLISELISKDGQRVSYDYNRWGDLSDVTRPDGSRVSYAYLFQPSKKTSAVSTNSIEAWVPFTNTLGRIDYQRGIVGTKVWTNLISTHLILRVDNPDGRFLVNEYDTKGRVVKQFANVGLDQRPVQNATFIYQNDDAGNASGTSNVITGVTLVVDGLGNTNHFNYAKSKVTLVKDAEGAANRTDWHLDWYFFTVWEEDWLGLWWQNQEAESYPRSKSKSIDPRGLVTKYKYDSLGNVTNVTVQGDLLGDGNTNTTAVTSIFYNSNNLPARVIQPNGSTNLYFYTNDWLLAREEMWPLGASAADAITNQFGYTTVTNSTNGFVSYGLRALEVRAAGTPDAATNRYEYDERGYLVRVIEQTGTGDPDVIVTNRHSPAGWLEEQSDAAGRRTRFGYDPMGRMQQAEVFEPGATAPAAWNFSHYNESGDVAWTDGPRFGPEDYTWNDYDGGGRLTQAINWRSRAKADGTGVEAETGANQFSMAFTDYDVFGNPTRATDPRGNILSNRFDRIGRVVQSEWYSSSGESLAREGYGYEPGGQIAAHTNALGGFTLHAYNSRGQPILRRNEDGSTNRWRYYADGRLHREFLRNGAYWQRTYDEKNRRITNTFFNAANVALAANVSELDRRGNLIRYIDSGGFVSTNAYDGRDRVKVAGGPAIISIMPEEVPAFPGMERTNIVQQVVTNFYDASGAVMTNVNALGEKSVVFHDALGRSKRVEIRNAANALVREASYAYAENHHGVTVTNGSGASAIVSTSFTDNDGQEVLAVTYPGANQREFWRTSYDPAGNPVAGAHQSSTNGTLATWETSASAYDGLNRLRTNVERDNATAAYAYDAAGNLTNRVLPGGVQWQGVYDSASRLVRDYIIGSGGIVTRSNSYSYFGSTSPFAGLLQSQTDGRGVTCTHSYDDWLRVVTNKHSGPLAEHSLSTVFQYDARGYVTNISESYTNSSIGPATSVRLAYDAYGNATRELVFVGGTLHSIMEQSWDSAGRRSGLGAGSFGYSFTWDAADALASVAGPTGGGAYSYNTAGLLQSRTVGARLTSVSSRDGAGRPLARSTTLVGTEKLGEGMTWTGDGLLATHTVARNDTGQFTDERAYAYATSTRWLAEERLNLDATRRWTNLFTFDGGVAAGPGVLTRAGPVSTNLASWRGMADAFSRVVNDTNSMLRHTAYGQINAYHNQATVTAFLDGQPQELALINTGTSNSPTQWRATLQLSPGAHELMAVARHSSGYTTSTNRWFTNTASQITRSNTYDNAGQITQRVWRNPNGTTNRTHTLTWDALGRLAKVVERDASGSGQDWSAVYDPLGRRLQTTSLPVTNGVVLTAQAQVISSLFDPQVEFLELAASVNGQTTWKLHGPDESGDYGALNGRGGFEAIIPGPELFCPVLSDTRGDIHAVYDQDHGQLHWNTARSSAYGGVPGHEPLPLGRGADLVAASAHDGLWRDSTGYYWRGARYYDSESAQWLSFDPYGFDGGDNPFGYAGDPVNYTDPDGRLARGFLGLNGAGDGGGSGGGGGGGGGRPYVPEYRRPSFIGDFLGKQMENNGMNPFRKALQISQDYGNNLKLFDGNHGNAVIQTFNPAAKMLLRGSEAYDGLGLAPGQHGRRLTDGERAMSRGLAVVHGVETVGTAWGLRGGAGMLRGGFRQPSAGPPPLPGTRILLRDPGTGRFVSNPATPKSPYKFTDSQRRAAWKRLAEDPNSGFSAAERAQIKARGNRGPQRVNEHGELETMELSHEPVPLRHGGTEVAPRWPRDHAAVDQHRKLRKR